LSDTLREISGPKDDVQSTPLAVVGTFVRTGDYWTIGYGNLGFALRDLKGLRYIQRLLQHPGEEFGAIDLIRIDGAVVDTSIDIGSIFDDPAISIGGLGDSGEMLDSTAILNYKRRLPELKEELEDLRERGADERAEKVETEIDFLERELVRAVGFGGRDRRAGSASERARLNVTRAIKAGLRKITENHAALGQLLARSIRTGSFCSYIPDPRTRVTWQFSADPNFSTDPNRDSHQPFDEIDTLASVVNDVMTVPVMPEHKQQLVEELKAQPLIQAQDDLANQIARNIKPEAVPRGAVLIEQGASDTDLFMILRGTFSVAVDGRVIARLGAGQHVGEMAALTDSRRSATVVALEDAVVARFGKSEFFALAGRFPDLWRRVAAQLASRLNACDVIEKRREDINVGEASVNDAITVPAIAKIEKSEGQCSRAPRLSIVVLPFANISGEPEQDYFVDGVTESLITDLSRVTGGFVIARNTSFFYKDKSPDVRQLGRELDVRYVLEGSVQRVGNRMRVNVQLVAAETGNHIWADRFDKPVADLFDMQDEIVARLAGQLGAPLVAAEAQRAERSPHPDALDLCFQGFAHLHKGRSPEIFAQARNFFERALTLEPDNVSALVGVAVVDVIVGVSLMSDSPAACFAAAERTATKAVSLAPNLAAAHLVLGSVYNATDRAAQAIGECEHALALDRNLASAHAEIGASKILLGRAEETEAHILEAFRLSPRDNLDYVWMYIAGLAKSLLTSDEEAVGWLRRSIEANRSWSLTHFQLAAALANVGRLDEAHAAVQAGLALDPNITTSRARRAFQNNNPTYLAQAKRIAEGMRLAGMPER